MISHRTRHQPFAATRLTLPLRPVASTTTGSPTFRGGCSGSGSEGSSVFFRLIRRHRLRSGRRFGVASSSAEARVTDFTRSDGATRTGGARKDRAWYSNAANISVLIATLSYPHCFVCKRSSRPLIDASAAVQTQVTAPLELMQEMTSSQPPTLLQRQQMAGKSSYAKTAS